MAGGQLDVVELSAALEAVEAGITIIVRHGLGVVLLSAPGLRATLGLVGGRRFVWAGGWDFHEIPAADGTALAAGQG